jgi:peptidoglycan/LPS O-acetylase OafA/YrhL
MAKTESDRLYSLDVLRGIAALTVVFWHWQHFYSKSSTPFIVEAQPLFRWIFPLYRNGDLAVDFFFLLSGFIFFWLYPKKIFEGHVSAKEFFILRFSRLYPLHFLTLIIVAAQQFYYWRINGSYFIYEENNVFHFLLNLLFISSVKLEKGFSFNGPIWSVSVEVFVYFVFFLISKNMKSNFFIAAMLSMVGYFLIFPSYSPVGRGVGGFFLGGVVYSIYQSIIMSKNSKYLSQFILFSMVLLWTIAILLSANYFNPGLFFHFGILDSPPGFAYRPKILAAMVLFTPTILSFAIFERETSGFFKKLSILGDISYSSYLLHFPLQLAFATFVSINGISIDTFNRPVTLAIFLIVLILISVMSFHYIEMPLQRYLRKLWLRSKPQLS